MTRSVAAGARGGRLKPLPAALAVLLVSGGVAVPASAQQAFSSGWFAAKGAAQAQAAATGRLPGGAPVTTLTGARQSQAAREQLRRSVDNLGRTAASIAAQQAAQRAARDAALASGAPLPDGLAEGGLKVDANPLTAGWHNAKAPVQTAEGGRVKVAIEQTGAKAILNWETFNVGKRTTVEFRQESGWAVLNRVNDPQARPSVIQGQIKAEGTVMVVNRNGVVFDGTSQVNVRNLVAAAARITDAQFENSGLYGPDDKTPSFADALGKVELRPGAVIETNRPATVTQSGGYVLLLGREVDNAGTIATARGQAALAAGDSFVIKRGQGTEGNAASTTRGSEIVPSGAGVVANRGLILSPQGDITLAARSVEQAGVLASSTSVDSRGSIHLNGAGADAAVTLRPGAITAILVDADNATALDGQRDNLMLPSANPTGALAATDRNRRDLSLVRVDSGGTVDFQGDSLTLATGGQVAVKAGARSLVRDGAQIDVGGAIGVAVSMESNNIKINLQGNEQRDSPVNRDDARLNNTDVWLDRRTLVRVASGAGGYDGDRWYSGGGLLEVGGYLGTLAAPASHWLAQGGQVRFEGAEVVTQAGSAINLSGGTLDVQSGTLQQTWLRGQDGRLYTADRAPADLLYTGVYRGYEQRSERWGEKATRRFYNELLAPRTRYEDGYTVGRDAGALVISTRSAVLEGDLIGDTYQGVRQDRAPLAGLDGYSQSQRAVARGAALVVGNDLRYYDPVAKLVHYQLGATGDTVAEVTLGAGRERLADGLDLAAALPQENQGKLFLDVDRLNGFSLGRLRIAAGRSITVDSALRSADGGEITLYAPEVDINADLVSRGGLIQAGNVLLQPSFQAPRIEDTALAPQPKQLARLHVASGAMLDARGVWANLLRDADGLAGLPVRDGGRVALRGTGDVTVDAGSVLDVSAGASVLTDGKLQGGKGGSVTLAAHALSQAPSSGGVLSFDGEVRGYGVTGGGTLSVASGGRIVLGGSSEPPDAETLRLDPSLFRRGFGKYEINGYKGLAVADGAQIEVAMPVLRLEGGAAQAPGSGAQPGDVLSLWTPPLYTEDPLRGRLTQRAGADLALYSDRAATGGPIVVGEGARVSVDPGGTIQIKGADQLTLLGRLDAWGGRIAILEPRIGEQPYVHKANPRSVWIGGQAVLDVAGRSHVAVDAKGRRYGVAQAGGTIEIGGKLDWEADTDIASRPIDRHIILRPGSLLDASGTQAVLDLPGRGATVVGTDGGAIVLSSANSLHLDGALRAAAGSDRAAGGTLGVSFGGAFYQRNLSPELAVQAERQLVLAQRQGESSLAADLQPGETSPDLAYGRARLGVDRIAAGGFDNLALNADVRADGSVALAMRQSLRLSGALSLLEGSPAASVVSLGAPYVLFNQSRYKPLDGADFFLQLVSAPLRYFKAGHRLDVSAGLLDARGNQNLISFDDVRFDVQGDMRLGSVGFRDRGMPNKLAAPNRLTVTAAQIYPTTGSGGAISMGEYTVKGPQGDIYSYNPDAVLTLRRAAGDLPATPYSAFGSITLVAPLIEQGGVLRAPLGIITFESKSEAPSTVRFLPGSLTSISGGGLLMPYGGTVDGVKYLYAGKEVELDATRSDGFLGRKINIQGKAIEVAEGAVLDLSGGGELTGGAFVRGRGGSVDVLRYAMADANPGFAFSSSGNAVYAIVPGYTASQAPVAADAGAGSPAVGRQVTIGTGVPGLPAGTYTLLPSTYALLPGAFRVELGAQGANDASVAARTRGGSWVGSGWLGTARTGQQAALPNRLLITPADVLRRHAQYNETSYNAFVLADAARKGTMRGMLTSDARALHLSLAQGAGMEGSPALSFKGVARFDVPQDSGAYAGRLVVTGPAAGLEVLAPGQSPVLAPPAAAVYAADLNALTPGALFVGGLASAGSYEQGSRDIGGDASRVLVRSGATLRAPEILLYAVDGGRGIVVEQGATLSTLGRGAVAQDASTGLYYSTISGAVLAVSNGRVNLLPPTSGTGTAVDVGGCVTACAGAARLLSEGSIGVSTNGAFTWRDSVQYGTRHLALSVSAVNLGSAQALEQAGAAGRLPPGMALNQEVLGNLLRGNTALEAPALESLILNAGESVNVYGAVSLDARGAGGRSLQRLVLGAPAIYGYGAAGDTATIAASEFVWAGSLAADRSGNSGAGAAKPQAPGGAILDSLGHGSLNVVAGAIRLEASPYLLPNSLVPAERLMLGFSSVVLDAAQMISGRANGSLSVYHGQDGYAAQEGWRYRGGDLQIRTPLLTGEAGSVMHIKAGGALAISGTGAVPAARDALGATLSLAARSVALDTTVALPSGKLSIKADGDILLGAGSRIDLSGREVRLLDALRYSWGGDLELQSMAGNIAQARGALIDVSARNNRAGRLQAIALGAGAGRVDLGGAFRGAASGLYDAGGTLVPYESAEAVLRAQTLADFADLNARLTEGGVFGARRFQIKRGDLVVGDELRARHVELALDGGSLTVNGRIDASGPQVGSIRLAAMRDLAVNGMLDAHGAGLRVDSHGKIIDSANRAIVDLTSREGTLTLGAGAGVDLRAGVQAQNHDGVARGTLDLNARRLGGGAEQGAIAGSGDGASDVAVVVAGSPAILGAKTVAVNAFRRYDDAPLAAAPDVTGKRPQEITQGYLDDIDRQNQLFMNAASANSALGARLSGLGGYRLRPGVEIVSATPDGDLSVVGDIDLSNHRYGPNADRATPALRGYGEPGVLVLRAGGNLSIYGSINDGFAPPPDSPDDAAGWQLVEGRYGSQAVTPYGGDLVVPIGGVKLEAGTSFPAGRALNYDLPANPATLPAGTVLPVALTLDAALSLPAGLVLTGDVTTADGSVLRAGTVLAGAVGLAPGSTLGAGFVLRSQAAVRAFTWPKNVALPAELVASGRIVLAQGSLIPSQTKVVLLDGKPVDLRPKGPDGKQGRNWALAPMLGPGASAWSLTAVAGADLESADVRARNVLSKGDLVLADTHYGLSARATETSKTIFVGMMVLTAAGAAELFGDPALVGRSVKEVAEEYGFDSWEQLCTWGDYCAPAPRTVSESGSLNWWGDLSWVGKPVEELAVVIGVTPEEFCADASNCAGGGSSETIVTREYKYGFGSPAFSVLRTGAGDLSLLAGRDVGMASLYGVYTAGTQASLGAADARFNLPRGYDGKTGPLGLIQMDGKYDAAMAAYQAWYPDQGGNLTVEAGRDVYGDAMGSNADNGVPFDQTSARGRYASTMTGAWLWRQGSIGTPGVADIAPSWWINFGAYAVEGAMGGGNKEPRLVGFTGFGTLGGGNLSISAGRDAGVRDARGDAARYVNGVEPRSQGLTAVVGSTGRVLDGSLVQTGGGDLDVRIGGSLNPSLSATQLNATGPYTGGTDHLDLNGVLVNLRGRLALTAGQVGGMALRYGDGAGLRAKDPYAVGGARPMGGPRLVLGDATAWIDTRGDLVLAGVSDPGRVTQVNSSPYQRAGQAQPATGGGDGWFTLWTPATAVNLFSAGGNLTPMTVSNSRFPGDELKPEFTEIGSQGRSYFVYPSILRAVAASGNIMLAPNAAEDANPTLLLAPSAGGQLELLAGRSILAEGAHTVSMSSADAPLPTPLRPAFSAFEAGGFFNFILTNTSREGVLQASAWYSKPLFAFGPGTPLDRALHAGDSTVARFYAATGDIVGLKSGAVVDMSRGSGAVRSIDTWYEAAVPVSVRAGRDILRLDVTAVHSNARDLSLIEAGRDIVYANAQVAGPGTLLLQAARQFRQDDAASVRSLGAIVRGDTRPGADLAVLAGVGAAGPDYAGFLSRYLDGARGLQPGAGLGPNPDKVAQAYGGELTLRGWLQAEFGYAGDEAGAPAELARQQALRDADAGKGRRDLARDFEQESGIHLVNWLRKHHGYQGGEQDAGAALAALAPAERGIYARQLFFAELKEGGREYNDDGGPRFGSYLRGRRAIAALFPDANAAGAPARYEGSFTMYGGAGLRSDFGGGIQLLTPGGQQVLGVEGVAPPASAGVVTQGQGDIQLYAQGSVLLGQSRIMTTFGGHIQAWSAEGDINAGRGAKTTVLYTPPRRVYDAYGNVTLSPTVPSTGAGIGTLAPIPEVPAGDVDLIAPLGTIDAGEAGIRVSGNVNVAALRVVNAANIQVQGESKGIPVTVSVNTNALTSASAAAATAATAAQDVMQRERSAARQNQPSIFSVQILGFGGEPLPAGSGGQTPPPRPPTPTASYDPGSAVRVLGLGELPAQAQQQLTEREQSNLGQL
ncbi:filamentous hemagglutinin family protein [Achromobacter sp. NPDC058515]|uniref:filamentous haemagglutinin family protein n=1 Tax=Achromobacter sp. NPDC058515 TaxID=3346533 RepID=UPI003646F784